MQDHEPTIRSRALGKRLRSVMTAADFNGRELAGKLGWAQSTVSRILAGKHFATETDVAALLAVCDVVGEQRRNLLRLATEVHVLGNTVPRWLNTYAEHEADARRISQFQCVVLPDILQTEDYARAQLVAAGRPDSVVTRECVALLDRARPPRMEFVVHGGCSMPRLRSGRQVRSGARSTVRPSGINWFGL
jgi:transcriptional regulator with XRE-family HTH domain